MSSSNAAAAAATPAFYEALPAEAKSVFYGKPYYDRFLTIVLAKMAEALASVDKTVGEPVLFFDEWLLGFLYTVDVHFASAADDVLTHTVRERGADVPSWILVVTQQLPFVEVVSVSEACYRVFTDFRRVPPPAWVLEKKAQRAIDNTIDIQAYLRDLSPVLSEEGKDALSAATGSVAVVQVPKPKAQQPQQRSLTDMFAKKRERPAEQPVPVDEALVAKLADDADEDHVTLVATTPGAQLARAYAVYVARAVDRLTDPLTSPLTKVGARDVIRQLYVISQRAMAANPLVGETFVTFRDDVALAQDAVCALSGRGPSESETVVQCVMRGGNRDVVLCVGKSKVRLLKTLASAFTLGPQFERPSTAAPLAPLLAVARGMFNHQLRS